MGRNYDGHYILKSIVHSRSETITNISYKKILIIVFRIIYLAKNHVHHEHHLFHDCYCLLHHLLFLYHYLCLSNYFLLLH